MNPEAERECSLVGRIQAGIRQALTVEALVLFSEKYGKGSVVWGFPVLTESRNNHCAATADELREVSDNGAAYAGTDFHPDGCAACGCVVEAFALSHECGVGILGCVTEYVQRQYAEKSRCRKILTCKN